jgi:hypothetical protein
MTTIRDILLSALDDVGAAGFVDSLGESIWRRKIEDDLMPLDHGARIAFDDSTGRLVPLPEGWETYGKCVRKSWGLDEGASIFRRRGRGERRGGYIIRAWGDAYQKGLGVKDGGQLTHFPTAPAAWEAVEAWIMGQG